MSEVWKNISGYEGIYEASTEGRIRRVKYAKDGYVLSLATNNKYKTISLYVQDGGKAYNVHRLIAETFIPNPENKPCVNHIDGDKFNNNIDNLEWCTYSENNQHAFDNGLSKAPWEGVKGEHHPVSKSGKIRMPCGDILIFKCQTDLVKEFGLHQGNLNSVLNGNRNHHKGWTIV